MTTSLPAVHQRPGEHAKSRQASGWAAAALSLGALGVVYGDIGTSPLYTIQLIFSGTEDLAPSVSHVYGAISLIFWSLLMVVTLKYVLLILRADNHGEGGIMALVALLERSGQGAAQGRPGDCRHPRCLAVLRRRDADAGDLRRVGGVRIAGSLTHPRCADRAALAGDSDSPVLPPALRHGRRRCAVRADHGRVVRARSRLSVAPRSLPTLGSSERSRRRTVSSSSPAIRGRPSCRLASVFLAVTGAEAIYADMGHFGRKAITRAWLAAGASGADAELHGPGRADPRPARGRSCNPFFRLVPGGRPARIRWWCSPRWRP